MPTLNPSTYEKLPAIFSSSTGTTSEYSSVYENIPNDHKVSARGIDPAGTTKNTNNTVAVSTAEPVAGQKNATPTDSELDSSSFDTDGYRRGIDGYGVESFSPRTVGDDGEDGEDLASISVQTNFKDDSQNIEIISAYSRFFLQAVTEPEQEKYQIVETFAGFYAFFFGKRPPVYRFSGVLLADKNYRWNNDFKYMYENYFRGTSAATLQAEVILTYDGRIVIGFPLSFTMQQEASNPKGIPFAMDVLVVEHKTIEFSKDIQALIASKQAEMEKLRQDIAFAANLGTGSAATVQTSDLVTNGLQPASSMSIPGVGSVPNPIGQVRV